MKGLLIALTSALAAASPLTEPSDLEERHFNWCPKALCCVKGSTWSGAVPYWTSRDRMMWSKGACGQKCAGDASCKTYAVGGGKCNLYKKDLWLTVRPNRNGPLDFAAACCAKKNPPPPPPPVVSKTSTKPCVSTAKSSSSSKASSSSSSLVTSRSTPVVTPTSRSTPSPSFSTPISTPTPSPSSTLISTPTPSPSSTTPTSTPTPSSSSTPIITPTPSSSTPTPSPTPSSTLTPAPPAPTCGIRAFISQKFSEDAYYDYDYSIPNPTFAQCKELCATKSPRNLYTKQGFGPCLIFAPTEDYCLMFYQAVGHEDYIPKISDADATTSIYGAVMYDYNCPDGSSETPTPTPTPTPTSTPIPTPTPSPPTLTCRTSALIGPGYDARFIYDYSTPPSFDVCKSECANNPIPGDASGPCVLFGVPKRDTDGYCLLTYPKRGSTFVPSIDKLYLSDSPDAALWYDAGCPQPPAPTD